MEFKVSKFYLVDFDKSGDKFYLTPKGFAMDIANALIFESILSASIKANELYKLGWTLSLNPMYQSVDSDTSYPFPNTVY